MSNSVYQINRGINKPIEFKGLKAQYIWYLGGGLVALLQNPLIGEVHVDEFYIGQPEEQKRDRSKGEKRLVIVALEKVQDGVGRAYAQVIESASSENLKPFFNNYIDVDTVVFTDEWRGYLPLKKEYQHLKQIPIRLITKRDS